MMMDFLLDRSKDQKLAGVAPEWDWGEGYNSNVGCMSIPNGNHSTG